MIIIGIILIFCGGVAGLWANNMQNSFEYNWYEFWGSSDYSYVNVVYYVGIFALIIGVILLIVGCTKKIAQPYNFKTNNIINNTQPVRHLTTCINCRAEVEQGIAFCPFCGSSQNTEQENMYRFCKNCGAKIIGDVNFCPECGSKMGG